MKGKIYKTGDENEGIKFNESAFFSSCGDYIAFLGSQKQVIIYDAKTLEKKYGPHDIKTFDESSPLDYVYEIKISSKCKYLFARSYNDL